MCIAEFILCIIMAAIGVVLLVAGKDNALANISGVTSLLLGAVWGGFYFAMLTSW